MPRKKKEHAPAAVPAVVAADPGTPPIPTPDPLAAPLPDHPHPDDAPRFVADAGAAFQQDRSGAPRGREITEGAANFAAFSQSIRDAAKEAE